MQEQEYFAAAAQATTNHQRGIGVFSSVLTTPARPSTLPFRADSAAFRCQQGASNQDTPCEEPLTTVADIAAPEAATATAPAAAAPNAPAADVAAAITLREPKGTTAALGTAPLGTTFVDNDKETPLEPFCNAPQDPGALVDRTTPQEPGALSDDITPQEPRALAAAAPKESF